MSGPGPTNSICDVDGLRVGHATLAGDGSLSGTTVLVCPPAGAVAGVDVRGGGPGTRETDLLDPATAVQRVHAIVLSGGSAFGLAAADGVMRALLADGIGLAVDPARGIVVPIVPAAVVFDLGRAGSSGPAVDADTGRRAYAAANGTVQQGGVGAGTGAVVGGLKGGVGTASAMLEAAPAPPGPVPVVGALAVVNAAGSAVDPASGELYGARFGFAGEFGGLTRPDPAERRAAAARLAAATSPIPAGIPVLNTTIGVVATDLALTQAQCTKLAQVAHDGLARAIRPAHTMLDGDTVFAVATGRAGVPDAATVHEMLTAAADCFTRAIVHAVLAARGVSTPAGSWPSYRETFPSAVPAAG